MFNFPDHQYDFSTNPCQYFEWGKQKASTMSLTVLVLIEMFNAINALSQEKSLLQTGLFLNPLLIIACCVSFGLHLVILYHHDLGDIFGVDPLSRNDWNLIIGLAAPFLLVDEALKLALRTWKSTEKKSPKAP